jgi:hypothetical protein
MDCSRTERRKDAGCVRGNQAAQRTDSQRDKREHQLFELENWACEKQLVERLLQFIQRINEWDVDGLGSHPHRDKAEGEGTSRDHCIEAAAQGDEARGNEPEDDDPVDRHGYHFFFFVWVVDEIW